MGSGVVAVLPATTPDLREVFTAVPRCCLGQQDYYFFFT